MALKRKVDDMNLQEEVIEDRRILTQFVNESGESIATPFDLPLNVTVKQLQSICNTLIKQDEPVPYAFFVKDEEIKTTIDEAIQKKKIETEKVLEILCQPQAVFRVRPVTRCTSSLPGHAEAVVSASFSPDGRYLASGSGDTTVRFWDINTETPHFVCRGHNEWVLCISWSPDGRKLASGSGCKTKIKRNEIRLWDPETGKQMGKTLTGHSSAVTCLAWEPLHLDPECRRLASSSRDSTIRIWDTVLGQTLVILSGHENNKAITCIKWGGTGLIYSASQDRTINVWRADDGILCRTLKGHAHWVNCIALNTDYVMRTGAYDPRHADVVYRENTDSKEQLATKAKKRYEDVRKVTQTERLVSGSDDYTLYLWRPEEDKKPIAHMTGHQGPVNEVKFSPDGRLIASAAFDKSIKLWDAKTGKFVSSLRGHVQEVYQIAWSADSRMIVSGSKDSTLKVWNIEIKQLLLDLPGHADEVYAIDWSPDGQRVVSGGKDKVLKIWRK